MDHEVVGARGIGRGLGPPGNTPRRLLKASERLWPQTVERPHHGGIVAIVEEALRRDVPLECDGVARGSDESLAEVGSSLK